MISIQESIQRIRNIFLLRGFAVQTRNTKISAMGTFPVQAFHGTLAINILPIYLGRKTLKEKLGVVGIHALLLMAKAGVPFFIVSIYENGVIPMVVQGAKQFELLLEMDKKEYVENHGEIVTIGDWIHGFVDWLESPTEDPQSSSETSEASGDNKVPFTPS